MARSKKTQELIDGALSLSVASDQVGLGVDIVEIERIRAVMERSPAFIARSFSDEERAYCLSKAQPEVHFATRFAAKEAVVKALGCGFAEGVWVRDIEVRNNAKGRPEILLHGRAKEIAREEGVREIPVSLSFTHTEAVAFAMAITSASVVASQKRIDPMEELGKQFKEARSLLDDIDASPAVPSDPQDDADAASCDGVSDAVEDARTADGAKSAEPTA